MKLLAFIFEQPSYCVCHAFASVRLCLAVNCWERADLLALVCDVDCVVGLFECGILGKVWYLIVSIPDLCHLSTFLKRVPITVCGGF